MALLNSIYDSFEYEYNLYGFDDEVIEEKIELINNNISMLRLYLSDMISNQKSHNVEPRPNYKYLTECALHYSSDNSVVISENDKAWFCYGCGYGGKIIDYIMQKYNLEPEKSIDILLSFINKDVSNLSKLQKEIYNKLFLHYNDEEIDDYIKKSEEKTEYLAKRINNYITRYNNKEEILNNINKISNRLSCSKKHVKQIIYSK